MEQLLVQENGSSIAKERGVILAVCGRFSISSRSSSGYSQGIALLGRRSPSCVKRIIPPGVDWAGGRHFLGAGASVTAQSEARPRIDLYGDPLPEGALSRIGTSQLRHGQATRLVFTADGKTLISAGANTVCFWDVASGKLQRVQQLPRTQKVEAMSADGKTPALSSAAHLHVWDIVRAKEIQCIDTGELVTKRAVLPCTASCSHTWTRPKRDRIM